VAQVCRIDRQRTVGEKKSDETVYYITSLSREKADANRLLELTRGHWGAIENGLHWVRDEVLGEDRSPIFRGHAPQNLAALRNTALNWLRREGIDTFASTLRSFARNPLRLFTKLGYRN
jgi:predicted transposase YbfD/YdcC